MTTKELAAILENIKCFDREFLITNVLIDQVCHWHLQVTYWEADIDTGKEEMQKSRKWLISATDTETDVVHTAFAAVMRSYDHVVQEHFTYKGKRIYSPHFSVEDRLKIAP